MARRSMTEDINSFDVAVLGTGPAGLLCSITLANRGWHVALIGPEQDGSDWRTVALMQGSVDFLQSEELWEHLSQNSTPLKEMRLIDASSRLFHAPPITFRASEIGLDGFGENVPLSTMIPKLNELVKYQTAISRINDYAVDFKQSDDGVTVELAQGNKVVVGALIDASGKKSKLRDIAGLEVKSWTYPQAALVTTLQHSLDHHFISTEFHHRTGPTTFVPMDGKQCGLVLMEHPDTADRLSKLPPDDLALEIEKRCQSYLGKLTVTSSVQVFPLSGHYATQLVQGNYALVGETAHAFPPIGAQGLNLTIRDIRALATCLGQKGQGESSDIPSKLKKYERKRIGDIVTRTRAVDALDRSLLTGFLPAQLGRTALLTAAKWMPGFRSLLMHEGIEPGRSARKLFDRAS